MTPKTFTYMLVLALTGLTTLGCGADEPTNDTSARDVQRESQEAIETAKDYLSDEMKTFIQDSEQRIAELEEKAKAWRSEVDDLSEDARATAREELAEIESKTAKARRHFEALREETSTAGEDLKTGAEAALDDLQKAYDRAASRFQNNT